MSDPADGPSIHQQLRDSLQRQLSMSGGGAGRVRWESSEREGRAEVGDGARSNRHHRAAGRPRDTLSPCRFKGAVEWHKLGRSGSADALSKYAQDQRARRASAVRDEVKRVNLTSLQRRRHARGG